MHFYVFKHKLFPVFSKYTYIDIIFALNVTDNFTASGELFIDDPTKKSTNKPRNF